MAVIRVSKRKEKNEMAFYKIRPKSGTADQWTTANPVLGEREIGYEYPTGGLGKGIVQMKMGDGKTAWNDLPYAQVIPMTKNDIVTVESTANDKVPSAGYVKKKFDSLNSTLGNKIIIGSNKDTVLIVTDQTINFLNGQGTVNVSSIASAYSKTVRNAIVQLKSASSAVVTSATVSENKVAVKCSNLSGTAFTGNIATTVLLFMY